MKAYQLIIFDWEGTLSDKDGLVLLQLEKLTQSIGLKAFDKKKASELLSLDFYAFMRTLYGDTLASHQILGLKDKFRQNHYLYPHEVCLFPEVKSLLDTLQKKGVMLGIATGKGRESLNKELEKAGIQSYFCATRTPCECLCKPAPDMLEALMSFAGVETDKTLMVGDSLCDVEAAQNANVDCIFIDAFKQQDENELLNRGVVSVLQSVSEIKKYLYP